VFDHVTGHERGKLVIDWKNHGAVTFVLGAMRIALPIYATSAESRGSSSPIEVRLVAVLPLKQIENKW
jgi:hypothetical protein